MNVADQRRHAGSFLHWLTDAIRTRRETPEVGWGDWQVVDAGDERVLCLQARWQGRCLTTLHNLAPDPVEVAVSLGGSRPEELLADRGYALIEGDEARFELAARGFRWLRVASEGAGTAGEPDRPRAGVSS
ncbi:MAG: alpha-glucosidase C-terminal domain-containing protein [Thermoleophilia bacterium]